MSDAQKAIFSIHTPHTLLVRLRDLLFSCATHINYNSKSNMDINSVSFYVAELVRTIARNPRNTGQTLLRCGVSAFMAGGGSKWSAPGS